MELQNDLCAVQISVDLTYTVKSADNKHYDLVFNPEGYGSNAFYKTLAIHINSFSDEMDIALVGDFYSYDSDCALLDENILTIMQNDAITQLDITDGTFLRHKKLDCFGCNFGLYRVANRYLVYGEIEITMLNLNFNKVWAFSGKDIFVTQSDKKPFEICEHSIKLYDWDDNYYELDFDGNLIFERSCK